MSENERLKRLRYRSWHRGCKETDLILGHFADSGMATLAPELLSTYEQLLDEDDADIWDWIIGKTEPSSPAYLPLLDILKGYGQPNE